MATQLKEPTKIPAAPGTVHWLRECISRGKKEAFAHSVMLSPGLAAEILRANNDNRNIRQTKLDQYTTDIRSGQWSMNGEPIIIAKNGELNDGQHRCQAVIDANKSIPVMMTFGIERGTRLTVDQGAARSAADYLGMNGTQYATSAAVTARMVIAYERTKGASIADTSRITNAEIMRRVKNDKEILPAAAFAQDKARYTKPFASPGIIGAVYYILHDICPEDAKHYMMQVCLGEELTKTAPAFTVRTRLAELGRTHKAAKMEVILHGWNAFRQNRSIKQIRVQGGFPALV